MRMSSFIIGGMVGAALSMYWNRNNKSMMQTLSNIGQFVNTMMDRETSEDSSEFAYESNEEQSSYHMQ